MTRGRKAQTEASADTQAPGPGHNSTELTEDQKMKVFFDHVREYKAARADKKEADDAKREQDAIFKNVCKRIKGEGTKVEDILEHIEMQSPEGEAKALAKMQATLRIARWNGFALGTQGSLFGDAPVEKDRPYAQGKRDALAGEQMSTRFAAGTREYERYREGYHEGQAVTLEGIKPLKTDDGESLWDAARPDPLADSTAQASV